MKDDKNYHGVLSEDRHIAPFPMHNLKRVDKPTNIITADVQRVDSRESAFRRAARGDYGPTVQREQLRPRKEPVVAAQVDVLSHLSSIKSNEVASHKAPIPKEPEILSRHIKSLGYYLKADVMGICQVPEYAVYSHDGGGRAINLEYQYAIVIVMAKDLRTVRASNGYDWIVDSISFQSYLPLAITANTIANYIRRLGYPASA